MAEHQGVRLQKLLADAGVASRRAAEKLIADGAVTVNGETVTELGTRANPLADEIRVHGKPLDGSGRPLYLMLHKPPGYVTTASDEHGRATIFDLLNGLPGRVFSVGRLDRDSQGLLLLTNDGELTVRLTHPRYGVEKEYQALVEPSPVPLALQKLREGVEIDGAATAPAQVTLLESDGEQAWLDLVMHEGRNRQVRRMTEAVGLHVRALVRVRVGPLELGRLPPGRYRALTDAEVAQLKHAVGLETAEAEPPAADDVRRLAEPGPAEHVAPRQRPAPSISPARPARPPRPRGEQPAAPVPFRPRVAPRQAPRQPNTQPQRPGRPVR